MKDYNKRKNPQKKIHMSKLEQIADKVLGTYQRALKYRMYDSQMDKAKLEVMYAKTLDICKEYNLKARLIHVAYWQEYLHTRNKQGRK